jgi:hypothetical protein
MHWDHAALFSVWCHLLQHYVTATLPVHNKPETLKGFDRLWA